MSDRIVLHCDMNGFYAAVECLYDPEVRSQPVAVCGDPNNRHGIVLAKNEPAKKFGVKTGEAVWQAKQKCPHLIVRPPRFDLYKHVSQQANAIYNRYTDRVEPFGIDESWLELTDTRLSFKDGVRIANDIRRTISTELGVTVSVGVSFNKIFAKIGSDLKKPDATTVISRSNFRDILFPLPCDTLLYIGSATRKRLRKINVETIGDLATIPVHVLRGILGKWGEMLSRFANGYDTEPVALFGSKNDCKGIGNSTTTPYDLTEYEQVKPVIYMLAESVSERMCRQSLMGNTVALWLRNSSLTGTIHQKKLSFPIASSSQMAEEALSLLNQVWENTAIRSIGIRMTDLVYPDDPFQMSFFTEREARHARLDTCIIDLRRRFGHDAISRALCLAKPSLYINPIEENTIHPISFVKHKLEFR